MSEVDVKRNQREEKGVTRRNEGESGAWGNPFDWWHSSEFFSDPASAMRRFRDDMDRLFWHRFGDESGERSMWSPAIEVKQNNGNLQVHADLPGLKPEEVKIEVTDNALVIQGERKQEHEEKGKGGVYRSERRYGRFYRSIPLPEGAQTDQAKARFEGGVLEVTLPVPERKSNRREIPISTEGGTAGRK